jgi:hypothetical protein
MIVDRIYEQVKEAPGLLENYTVEILEILKEINLHQSLKEDQKRLEKIITDQNTSYFNFLKIKGNKDIIDTETLERCTKGVEILRNHGRVRELLGLDKISDATKYGIYNEIMLESPLDNLPFGLKGILDNLTVDVEKKIVYINDLKTSGKTISDFAETVNFWNYWLQAAIYKRLAQHYLKDVLTPEWMIIFNFIVLDKYHQVYPFQVSDDTMEAWDTALVQKLGEAEWHFKNRDFSLPYDFAKGQIML